VDSLRAAGLTVLGSDTVGAALDRLRSEGPAAPQRFALLTATLGILLAAAAVTVAATVEREPRVTELLALREQGLPGRVAGSIGYGSYAVLTVLGVLAGLAAAVVAHAVVDIRTPMFVDAWDTLPPPSTGPPVALLAAGLVGLVAIGLAGWAAARSLARRVSRTGRGVGS
jgi:predicted lysophospholipase L1 biosynthesis ABC-type transport system permease subunit